MEQGPTYSSILLLNEPPLKCSGLKQQLFTSYESIDWLYRSVLCGISWACSRLETCAETFKMSHSHVHSWALWDTGMVRLIICLPARTRLPARAHLPTCLPTYLSIYLPTCLPTYLTCVCLCLSFSFHVASEPLPLNVATPCGFSSRVARLLMWQVRVSQNMKMKADNP